MTSDCSNWLRPLLLDNTKELFDDNVLLFNPLPTGQTSRSCLTGLLLVSSVQCTGMQSSSTVDSSKNPPVCDEQMLSLSCGRDAYDK